VTYAECVYGYNSASAWFLRYPRRLRRRGLIGIVVSYRFVKVVLIVMRGVGINMWLGSNKCRYMMRYSSSIVEGQETAR
jgi:hypothetical protein